jgi:maltose phosphorylase
MVKKQGISPSNIDATTDKIQFSWCNCGSRPKIIYQKIEIGFGFFKPWKHYYCCWESNSITLGIGYNQMLQDQIDAWAKIWEMSNITIDSGEEINSF